jgi:SAM-dependent methyltransferase
MSHTDAQRWDTRYQSDARFNRFTQPRPFLVENANYLPNQGLALDIAMGLGGNADFLLRRGLDVIGVDISWVAVRKAKMRSPALGAVVADLTRFYLPAQCFDVILNFFYLQRDLWPQYYNALRPGGILILETLTREMLSRQPDTDPAYLLAPGELLEAFGGQANPHWEILVYGEGWKGSRSGAPQAVASMIVRKT